MPRRRSTVVPLSLLALAAAACGSSSSHSASPGTQVPSSGTIPHPTIVTLPSVTTTTPTGPANAPTTAAGEAGPGSQPSTVVTVPGQGSYVLSARAGAGTGPCVTPGLDGTHLPFTVSVTNRSAATEPLARVAVAINDPKATGTQPVAALSYSGLCTNFTEPDGTLNPGQTITYDGSASGVSSSAVLHVTVISTPANDTLGQLDLALG